MDKNELERFLKGSIALEASIYKKGTEIREKSKKEYGTDLLDARLIFLSILSYIISCKSGVPGKTNESISERLLLIVTFIQGTYFTEALISEGQYVKAASALKQDFEIMTRIKEVRAGMSKYGKVPNIKNAPNGSRHFYGELNDLSHISKANILESVILRNISGNINGVSPLPVFNAHIAKKLYELHVFLCFEMAREALILFEDMYGTESKDIEYIVPFFMTGTKLLEKAGFEMSD